MMTRSGSPVRSKLPSTLVVTTVSPSRSATSRTLTVAPGLDRRQAPERAAVVVDNGTAGEEGDECVGIVAVRGSDVGAGNLG